MTKKVERFTPPWVTCLTCNDKLQVGYLKPRACTCGQVFVEYGRAYISQAKHPRPLPDRYFGPSAK